MGNVETHTRLSAWTKTSKVVCATSIPFGPKLMPVLSEEALALIREDALSLSWHAWLGLHPQNIQCEWNCKSGSTLSCRLELWCCQRNLWGRSRSVGGLSTEPTNLWHSPAFLTSLETLIWSNQTSWNEDTMRIRFSKLDDCYYRVLPELCACIRKVVWTREREDYLKKSSTSRPALSIVALWRWRDFVTRRDVTDPLVTTQ
jgi:hypothetical protein